MANYKVAGLKRGVVLNEKDALKEISKLSNLIKLSTAGGAAGLAKAVASAKALGTDLNKVNDIAGSILNFEESIEAELSAELLTGKDLNLEKARTLALNGDIAGAAEEIANQVGSSADFAKMNVIQQEALAKAAGLTKDQLAQSLMDREALAKLSAKEGESAQQAFNRLVKEVGMEEAKKRLGDEQLATQFQQQSVQERFNKTVEKLQEIFVQIAEPLLGIISPFMDLVGEILPLVNILFQPIISSIKVMGDMIKTYIKEPLEGVKSIFSGIMDIFKGDFESGIKKIGSGILRVILTPIQTIINGGISLINSTVDMLNAIPGVDIKKIAPLDLTSLVMGNDVFSPGAGTSGYGSRTLLGPEGAIALNNKDTVIAGTNLFDQKPEKANDMISGPKGAITVANSTAPKKETPVNSNSETNALLSQLLKGQKEVNAIPTLRIQ